MVEILAFMQKTIDIINFSKITYLSITVEVGTLMMYLTSEGNSQSIILDICSISTSRIILTHGHLHMPFSNMTL